MRVEAEVISVPVNDDPTIVCRQKDLSASNCSRTVQPLRRLSSYYSERLNRNVSLFDYGTPVHLSMPLMAQLDTSIQIDVMYE